MSLDATLNFGNVVSGSAALPSGIGPNYFYARWTGYLVPPTTGLYTIGVNCADGCNLTLGALGGVSIVAGLTDTDIAANPAAYTESGDIYLTAGVYYEITVEWAHANSTDYELQLLWTPPGGSLAVIPSTSLSTSAQSVTGNLEGAWWNGTASQYYPGGAGGPGFSISGHGWFFGGESWGPVEDGNGAGGYPANVVNCVQLRLDDPFTISQLAMYVITGAGAGYLCCALYSEDGNTKLIDAGQNAFDTHSHSQRLYQVTLSPAVVLSPGVYWFAWGSTDGNGAVITHVAQTWLASLFNASTPRIGTAANGITSGNMPSTLGTVTPLANTGGGLGAVPAVIFQV